MRNVLNCNNENGNVITERTAISTFFGKRCSIEEMYLYARRDEDNNTPTDKPLHHFLINGVEMPKADGKNFYELLWYQFFIDNKDLYKKVMSYDDFIDEKGNSINSPARVFRLMKIGGLTGLKSNCKEFLERFNKSKMNVPKQELVLSGNEEGNNIAEKDEIFTFLDTSAKKLVKKYYSSLMKSEIVDTAIEEIKVEDKYKDFLARLVNLRYDESADITSESFVKSVLNSIRSDYNKLFNDEGDDYLSV